MVMKWLKNNVLGNAPAEMITDEIIVDAFERVMRLFKAAFALGIVSQELDVEDKELIEKLEKMWGAD